MIIMMSSTDWIHGSVAGGTDDHRHNIGRGVHRQVNQTQCTVNYTWAEDSTVHG